MKYHIKVQDAKYPDQIEKVFALYPYKLWLDERTFIAEVEGPAEDTPAEWGEGMAREIWLNAGPANVFFRITQEPYLKQFSRSDAERYLTGMEEAVKKLKPQEVRKEYGTSARPETTGKEKGRKRPQKHRDYKPASVPANRKRGAARR